jgi:pyruvate formate lyase activating enzyme
MEIPSKNALSSNPADRYRQISSSTQENGRATMQEKANERTPEGSRENKSEMSAFLHEASLYETLPQEKVQCHLCAHRCTIAEGKRGVCYVRENINGRLFTSTYGNVISQHVDPIEKKPLYHFYPGTSAYSIATPGCNFRCQWCQNWEISQLPRLGETWRGTRRTVEDIIHATRSSDCSSIAYTYTEPTIFYEYAFDIAKEAKPKGISNVFVTNGYMTEEMLSTIHPYLDAANVDLKAFRDETYRKYVGARLQPILDSLKRMKDLGIWLEVTTLLIPDLNDDESELQDAANFIAQELGPETPWHISRFFPSYKMSDHPSTPQETLRKALEIGLKEGLYYIYLGNVGGMEGNDTKCPNCRRTVIRRSQFGVLTNNIGEGNLCPHCGRPIHGVGLAKEKIK